ncbi:hypothetical protein DESUT3_14320 [Desulfuromonas versatilis]|uniref:Tetratricopeptide repeat protein n=1 Tax=Desulfuromonas versatilis TaxID=2802975 RepID=A0ABN6DW61_9BACT|nr:tetratricopeptide repeat protein [Desulfuromonas versatilis]BCR04363.1 hypothetical protein DESUT3_14320 [Desulfuromonas versatilis]
MQMPKLPFFLALLFLCLLSSCAGSLPQAARLNAGECLARAEEAIAQRNYDEAAGYLDAAIHKEPHNAAAYLRHGEVLRVLGKDRQARSTYRAALKNLPDSPEKSEAAYHLALLQALKFDTLREALSLIPGLAEDSAEKLDLQGVVALQQRKFREALQYLSRAQQFAGVQRMGLVLYHASLAYHGLGDPENARASLFHAINQTDNLAEVKDIERFYAQLAGRGSAD